MHSEIEEYIKDKLEDIEGYSYYDTVCMDEMGCYTTIKNNKHSINLIEFNVVDVSHLSGKKLIDIQFIVDHKGIKYTFETANYIFDEEELHMVSIYDNMGDLLSGFEILLENYSDFKYRFHEDDDDSSEETIDSVTYSSGFRIDDDDQRNWIPIDDDLITVNEFDSLMRNIEYIDNTYVYDDIDEIGRFYW